MADRQSADRNERSASPGRSRTWRPEGLSAPRHAAAAAILVGAVAFALYHATLLPGLDFGDTASFQVGVTSSFIKPRDGYPLYFFVGRLFLSLLSGSPAHVLNVASSVESAVACALFVLVAAELSGSTLAAVAAGLLFAGSYTFWSQSIIAEVYALHAVFVTLTLLLLLRWAERPSFGRLALFFAVYALGFGNHLSMILLLPGFALFLLVSAPGGWRSMVSPRVVTLALACAFAGALQYAWNLRAFWMLPNPPHTFVDTFARFWFDVTKTDWRETMVMRVPEGMLANRLAMYAFELRQQFGWIGVAAAGAGLGFLSVTQWRRALLMFVLFAVNVGFAFGYNVGDSHVFYIPSHLLLALLAAPGLVLVGHMLDAPPVVAAIFVLYAGARMYRDYPALDRSQDNRPAATLAALTQGLDDRQAVLLTDLDWQVENGLTYFSQGPRPEIAHAWMNDVALYLPEFVADNTAIHRDVVVTERARQTADRMFGPLFTTERDPRVEPSSLTRIAEAMPRGVRYVICVLKPSRDFPLDASDLARALSILGDGTARSFPGGDYVAIAGIIGQRPTMVAGSNAPFERAFDLGGVGVDIRMDSWLASDTIRRMGYGHVISNRHHALIVERGVSFVAIDSAGEPIATAYAANLFAPQNRYLIRLAARP